MALLVCCAGSGCASIESARPAVPIDEQGQRSKERVTSSGLRVSGDELGDLSSRYFGALEFTFENTSDSWVSIERVWLDFGGAAANQAMLVPYGREITSWQEATTQRNRINAVNRAVALSVLGVSGAVVAVSGNNDALSAVGGLTTVGALGALAVDYAGERVRSAEQVRLFPSSHLLSGSFTVPPGLFVKRWLLLNTKEAPGAACLGKVVLTYTVQNRPYERVYLDYKRQSEWQKPACKSLYPNPSPGRHG